MDIIIQPKGIIVNPFNTLEDMPIQPLSDLCGSGIVEIYQIDGLKDLEGFNQIDLLYHFRKIRQSILIV